MVNIIEFFENSVNTYKENSFLWEKSADKYESLTYAETHKKVEELAWGFLAMGLQKGDRVALLSEGRNYWLISELALLYTGTINVPLSTKLEADYDLTFRLNHSESKYIIVSRYQLPKIRTVRKNLETIEKVIVIDDIDELQDGEITLSSVINKGEELKKENPELLNNRKSEVTPSDVANIVYTSGTTADPKGIMLTHRNYTANVEQAFSYIDIPEHFITLVVLPWDHAFAHTASLYAFMYKGASVASVKAGATPNETLKNFTQNMLEIKPHVLMSVPALAKNFRKNIEKGIKSRGETTYKLFKSGLSLAYWYNGNGENKGKGLKALAKPLYSFYKSLIFDKVKDKFGGRLEYFIGGGALLDIELQRFFYALGMPMYQGYGLSEASPIISANTPEHHKMGTSGKTLHGIEVKICDEEGNALPVGENGEIVIKGENVMKGYWKNDEATKDTIKEGWLYTGDLGYLDKDTYLYVLGRFKSLLIGADGEKYSPEGIEETITDNSEFIDQLVLHNNQNPYTVGLIVPNKDRILGWLKENGKDTDSEEAMKDVLQLILNEINEFKTGQNKDMFPQRWLPSTSVILTEPFTEQNKLLNSTMKIVRNKVEAYFKDEIAFLYTPESKNFVNQRNINNLKTFLKG
ncbi:MAG: AMP-binding protein [Chlorobi bacterium]|nr:AMP-binding protein [Chlorobiota bacterium]